MPVVDPLAGWCGGWGRKTPGYPIVQNSGIIKAYCILQLETVFADQLKEMEQHFLCLKQ